MNKPTSILVCLLLLIGCSGDSTEENGTEASNIHYFAWLSPNVSRGGQPVGEAAFRELSEKGIRTVISVDAARPDTETAARFGLRYVHVPFGYDRIPPEQQNRIAKTVRELDGPFFVHCHHGKHRGPAAAVIAQMALGGMTPDEAVSEMKRAGTAEKYKGLYASAEEFVAPDEAATKALAFDFPSVAPVDELAGAMATADRRFDGLKVVRSAGWQATEEHPDIDPPHEALQLWELFVEMGRTEEAKSYPEPFGEQMKAAEDASRALEAELRAASPDLEILEGEFRKLSKSCSQCHKLFRNN